MGSDMRQKIGVLLVFVLAITGTIALSMIFNDDEEEFHPVSPTRGTDRTTNDPMRAIEERERLGIGQKLQGHVDATYNDKLNREAIPRGTSLSP